MRNLLRSINRWKQKKREKGFSCRERQARGGHKTNKKNKVKYDGKKEKTRKNREESLADIFYLAEASEDIDDKMEQEMVGMKQFVADQAVEAKVAGEEIAVVEQGGHGGRRLSHQPRH